MAARFALKRGDTFLANCIYKDALGVAVNLDTAGIEITSKVRSSDGKCFFDLEVTLKDQVAIPGGYTVEGATADWPIGELAWDIRFEQDGRSFSSDTIQFTMREAVS